VAARAGEALTTGRRRERGAVARSLHTCVEARSPTTLREKLIKNGAKAVADSRYVIFQMV
jgi:hypothetical protein